MRCRKCKYNDPSIGAFNCPNCGTSFRNADQIKPYDIRDKRGRFTKLENDCNGFNYHVYVLGADKCSICGAKRGQQKNDNN